MVPGGPRPRNCGVGHAHGRRVSPWCLEIRVEHFQKTCFLGPCLSALDFRHRAHARLGAPAEVTQFCTVGPGDWQARMGGSKNMQNNLTFDVKTDQKPPDICIDPRLGPAR